MTPMLCFWKSSCALSRWKQEEVGVFTVKHEGVRSMVRTCEGKDPVEDYGEESPLFPPALLFWRQKWSPSVFKIRTIWTALWDRSRGSSDVSDIKCSGHSSWEKSSGPVMLMEYVRKCEGLARWLSQWCPCHPSVRTRVWVPSTSVNPRYVAVHLSFHHRGSCLVRLAKWTSSVSIKRRESE